MAERTDVAIIGSGFSGICMAMLLKRAGRDDFVILEKADDVGGTWRDNTYPGCACDVPSHLYSLSFRLNPHWSRLFSGRDEIWDYLRSCVATYRLEPHLRLGARVTGARFDETAGRWGVDVAGAAGFDCRVLVSGVGALHEPHIPDLPGLSTFSGTVFHSASWRHACTLEGQRVAVIGTGASAAQLVPEIAPRVRQLDLYQRTAAWITPRSDVAIPASAQRLLARRPGVHRALRDAIYWALELRGLGFTLTPKAMRLRERQARRHLARQVPDPELRSRLTPNYQMGCKRVLLSDDFYPSLLRDNVELVTDPIATVTPDGLRAGDGTERAADVIVVATGFDVSAGLTRMPVVGRNGQALTHAWSRDGVGAHLGITVSGFPNLFLLLGPNTGLGHQSVLFMIEAQARYVLQALDLLDETASDTIEVLADIQQRFVQRIQARLSTSVWQSGCMSWYQDANGRNIAIWPYATWKYWLQTRRLDPRDFRLTPSRHFVGQTAAMNPSRS